MKRFKKIVALMLSMTMMCTSSITVWADTPENLTEEYDYEKEAQVLSTRPQYLIADEGDDSLYKAEAKELIELGKISQSARANNFLNVYHYYQNGSQATAWQENIMKTAGDTIATSGCVITSFAMVVRFYNGSAHTPATVNSKMGDSACPFYRDTAATKYTYNLLFQNSLTYDEYSNLISGSIVSGKPVVINMSKTSGATHSVTAYGINGYNIHIYDPETAWNYSLLNSYLNNGWSIKSVYIYSKKV